MAERGAEPAGRRGSMILPSCRPRWNPCTRSTSTHPSSPTSCVRSGKTATIRLGDKSAKYRKGMVVQVLVGTRFSPREKIFDAVIDKVEVKQLLELSPARDRARQPGDPPLGGHGGWLSQLYNREVIGTDHGHRDPVFARSSTRSRPSSGSPCRRARRGAAGARAGSLPDDAGTLQRLDFYASANPGAELLRRAELGAALLALDGEGDAMRASAARARARSSPPHCGHSTGSSRLGILEVALARSRTGGRTRPSRPGSCGAPRGASCASPCRDRSPMIRPAHGLRRRGRTSPYSPSISCPRPPPYGGVLYGHCARSRAVGSLQGGAGSGPRPRGPARRLPQHADHARRSRSAATSSTSQGKIPGSFYTGRGNEAASVGVATAMGPEDVGTPLHRDMGVHITRGVEPWRIFAQYMGRADGPTHGRDGNVHMADSNLGLIAMVSHLPAMLPVAVGCALAFRIREEQARRGRLVRRGRVRARRHARGDEPRRRAQAARGLHLRQQPVGVLDADAPRVRDRARRRPRAGVRLRGRRRRRHRRARRLPRGEARDREGARRRRPDADRVR